MNHFSNVQPATAASSCNRGDAAMEGDAPRVILNARQTLDAVMKRMEQSRAIITAERAKVRADFDTIRPLLVGLSERAFGKEYRITQADTSQNGGVRCYGVRLRNGRAGTRAFDIGMLHDMTILEGPKL